MDVCVARQPSVLLIDDIDVLCKDDAVSTSVSLELKRIPYGSKVGSIHDGYLPWSDVMLKFCC